MPLRRPPGLAGHFRYGFPRSSRKVLARSALFSCPLPPPGPPGVRLRHGPSWCAVGGFAAHLTRAQHALQVRRMTAPHPASPGSPSGPCWPPGASPGAQAARSVWLWSTFAGRTARRPLKSRAIWHTTPAGSPYDHQIDPCWRQSGEPAPVRQRASMVVRCPQSRPPQARHGGDFIAFGRHGALVQHTTALVADYSLMEAACLLRRGPLCHPPLGPRSSPLTAVTPPSPHHRRPTLGCGGDLRFQLSAVHLA